MWILYIRLALKRCSCLCPPHSGFIKICHYDILLLSVMLVMCFVCLFGLVFIFLFLRQDPVYLRLVWDTGLKQPRWFPLLNTGIAGVYHHIQLQGCLPLLKLQVFMTMSDCNSNFTPSIMEVILALWNDIIKFNGSSRHAGHIWTQLPGILG